MIVAGGTPPNISSILLAITGGILDVPNGVSPLQFFYKGEKMKIEELFNSSGEEFVSEPLLISRELIEGFSGLTGDKNPIHLDGDQARAAGFKGVVAHGFLLISLIPRLLNAEIPQGWILINGRIQWSFREPVLSNTQILLHVKVKRLQKRYETIFFVLDLVMKNTEGKLVGQGTGTYILRRAAR